MPSKDEWTDAELTADDLPGRPLARTPEEGVQQMTRRIKFLEDRRNLTKTLAQARQLQIDLDDARRRLAEYQTQLKGKN